MKLLEIKQSGAGWECSDAKYGVWFISRQTVINDYIQDQKQEYGLDVANLNPDDETINVWFSEQISWIEVYHYGKQLHKPNMQSFEKSWLREMSNNTNWIEKHKEIK